MAAPVELFDTPVDVDDTTLGRRRVERKRAIAICGEDRHFTVFEVYDLRRVPNECRHIGRHHHLLFADPDDDRRTVPGHDEPVRLGGVDHRKPVGPFDPGQDMADGVFEVVAGRASLRDQVGERLGVGLAHKDHTGPLEFSAQFVCVLDDPVVHDGNVTGHVRVRVGIHVTRLPVGRPARVANADVSGQAFWHGRFERPELALLLADFQST